MWLELWWLHLLLLLLSLFTPPPPFFFLLKESVINHLFGENVQLTGSRLTTIAFGILRHKMLFESIQRDFPHMPGQGLGVGRAQLDCWLHQANPRVMWLHLTISFRNEASPSGAWLETINLGLPSRTLASGPSAEVMWPPWSWKASQLVLAIFCCWHWLLARKPEAGGRWRRHCWCSSVPGLRYIWFRFLWLSHIHTVSGGRGHQSHLWWKKTRAQNCWKPCPGLDRLSGVFNASPALKFL